MASTFTTNLGLTKQVSGENDLVWGDILNNGMIQLADDAISGRTSVSVTSGDVTLTKLDGVSDQSRAMHLIVTGTFSPFIRRVFLPNDRQKIYVVSNESDGTVEIKTTLGSQATQMGAGTRRLLFVDSVDGEVREPDLADTDDFVVEARTREEESTPPITGGSNVWQVQGGVAGAITFEMQYQVQGAFTNIEFGCPSGIGVTVNDTAFSLNPTANGKSLPAFNNVSTYHPIVLYENANLVEAWFQVLGNAVEILKIDGTPWVFGSIRKLIDVDNKLYRFTYNSST